MPTTSPRYSAPDRSRQRIRLIAAIGLLASTAIAIGGLVALLSSDRPTNAAPAAVVDEAAASLLPATRPGARDPLGPPDSLDMLVHEVERAERAAASARGALRRARMLGNIEPDQLDWLERRLDALGRDPAFVSPRPAPSSAPETRAPRPMNEGPREL